MQALAASALLLATVRSCAAAGSTSLTTYRITPRNYSGLTNFNSGDGPGDAFFGLYELCIPELCADQRMAHLPQCANIPILSIPGFNVYTQYTLEVDERLGEYAECNPDPVTGVFACRDAHRGCWYDNTVAAATFKDVCSNQQCSCDAYSVKSVGAEKLPFGSGGGGGGTPPPNWPKVCSATYRPLAKLALNASGSRPSKITTEADEASCCTTCTNTKGIFSKCRGYTYFAASKECQLFDYPQHTAADPNANSGYNQGGGGGSHEPKIFDAVGKLASALQELNATWYSTQAAGQCQPGQVVGKDCWWSIKQELRTVNASCVNDAMISNVKAKRPECWAACPDPTDMASQCWINCLFETLTGNTTTSPPVQAMMPQDIVEPFFTAFKDPSAGGCPTVPPCPAPCNPPLGM